jgi:hypothetical protein
VSFQDKLDRDEIESLNCRIQSTGGMIELSERVLAGMARTRQFDLLRELQKL